MANNNATQKSCKQFPVHADVSILPTKHETIWPPCFDNVDGFILRVAFNLLFIRQKE